MWVEIVEVKVALWTALSAFPKLVWTSLAKSVLRIPPWGFVYLASIEAFNAAYPWIITSSPTVTPSFLRTTEPSSVPVSKVYSGISTVGISSILASINPLTAVVKSVIAEVVWLWFVGAAPTSEAVYVGFVAAFAQA